MKWNESGLRPENLLRMAKWVRWHCRPDTGFEIETLEVWGRARYLSVTEDPHNNEFYEWMGKKHFCFFQTAETGIRTPNSSVKGSSDNHYPRAPTLNSLTTQAPGHQHITFSSRCFTTMSYVVDFFSGCPYLQFFLFIFSCGCMPMGSTFYFC